MLQFNELVADEEHGADCYDAVCTPFYVAPTCAGMAVFMPLRWWWWGRSDAARW
jgi:hypothetical protein